MIVIDTNIIISALIKDSATRKIIVESSLQFAYPEPSLQEIMKYKNYILEKSGYSKSTFDSILNKLLEYKEEFKGLHPDEFSMNFNLRTFKKYVIKDDDQLVFAKGASIYPRSAGYYNHLLYKQTDNIRKKYKKVRIQKNSEL